MMDFHGAKLDPDRTDILALRVKTDRDFSMRPTIDGSVGKEALTRT